MQALRLSPNDRRRSILIVCPAPPRSKSGNRVRALRYQALLRELGYRVRVETQLSGQFDLAIFINGYRCASAIALAKQSTPDASIVVVVSGTDLYRSGESARFLRSLDLADRIVVSQPSMLDDLPKRHRSRSDVIFQSAKSPKTLRRQPQHRRVIVCGHLRPVKDPFRAAMAVRGLPRESRIEVAHFGGAMDDMMAARAQKETLQNARYTWHGERTRGDVRRQLASAWLMVLSSKMEGGANVLSESIAAGIPILATQIPGTTGLLGQNYPGYFPVGDTQRLRELLLRAEDDQGFYQSLRDAVLRRRPLICPDAERDAWRTLLDALS